MDHVWNKLRRLSKNHLVLLGLCAVIGYLLRSHDSYILRPVWRKRAEYHHFNNKKYPTVDEQLPAPVVTDIDSDGISDIVLITNDLKLSVMTLPDAGKQDDDDKTLPHVKVKHKVVLPETKPGDQSEPSGWPVVLTTGFTTPYRSMVQVRRQIIIVVTNHWWVFCYSSDLELLWKRQVLHFSEGFDNFYVKAMGAMVTSQSVQKLDEGLVVVGGSYAHKSHLKQEVEVNTNESHANHTAPDEASYTHFSTFALSAKDGSTRWHHLPGEFGEDVVPKEQTEFHWKLNLKKHRLHIGESPWTYYKHELFKTLPHFWQSIKDTRFTLGRYQKLLDSQEVDDEDAPAPPTPSALDAKHIIGYAYGGLRPHSDIEHIANPNAVVINHQNGIEALNILTGRPITRLQLKDDNAVYASLDKEKDIKRLSWGEQENYSPCFIEIWRMFPISENLDRFPICYTKRLFFTTTWVYEEDMYKKLPPVIIKSIAKKSGVVRHLLGHHLKPSTEEFDIITVGSMGRVSSVNNEGDFNWQTQTGAVWAEIGMNVRKMKKDDWTEQKDEFLNSFMPARQLMSLQVFGEQDCLLMVGWNHMAIVELREGRLMAEHTLPCPPTGPPVIGDFNNDGWNDVIFTCKFGYIGFSVHRYANHVYTMMYAVAVFLLILVLAWLMSPETHLHDDSEDESSS